MGLASSQGRLLSITARLTSNEYESQQISNAKMRLSTQSQEASNDYIAALDSQQLLLTTYDAKGNSTSENLTAAAIYQFSDMKNQYALTNINGQALVSQEDASNFENSNNLDAFLKCYGVEKVWKSQTLTENYKKINGEVKDTDTGVLYTTYLEEWDKALANEKSTVSVDSWQNAQVIAYDAYQDAIKSYNDAVNKQDAGFGDVDLAGVLKTLNEKKSAYTDCITYDNYIKSLVKNDTTGGGAKKYENVEKYYSVLSDFNEELEDYGTTLEDAYTYSDESKAQWYTNLWYQLNGESSKKSKDGTAKTNYQALDNNLLSSSTWIQDALRQGTILLEVASYTKTTNTVHDEETPTVVDLKGITWTSSIYSSCTDITQKDDDDAVAKAEAVYEKKTEEINAKDEKYQAKIKNLDTEHTALQTEYESVKTAMDKNISRSYKTFSG